VRDGEEKRWSGALLIALVCAVLCGGSCGVSLVDYGAHVDGPGIGLEWSKPLGTGSEYGVRAGIVMASMVVQGLLSLIAFGKTKAKPVGVLALPLLALVGIIGGFIVGARALPAWWTLGCHRGHLYACYAAAGVTHGAASDAHDKRASAGGVKPACMRIARRTE
jgi:xanthosine utilization system XapX-like protein